MKVRPRVSPPRDFRYNISPQIRQRQGLTAHRRALTVHYLAPNRHRMMIEVDLRHFRAACRPVSYGKNTL
jgi:hypothetical protein